MFTSDHVGFWTKRNCEGDRVFSNTGTKGGVLMAVKCNGVCKAIYQKRDDGEQSSWKVQI